MILAHKIALDPTAKQRKYFANAAGCARFVWNLALERWNTEYAAGKKPSGAKLRKEFNCVKYQQYPWMKELHRDAHVQAFRTIQTAFNMFFKKKAKHPKFHKKGHHDSFYIANDQFCIAEKKVRIPRLGWVRMHEELRFTGKIKGAVVSRSADRWFIAIQVDTAVTKSHGEEVLGIDLGLSTAITLSTGEKLDAPKPLRAALRSLRRAGRCHSRKQRGSANKRKSAMRLAKIHWRVVNKRQDFLHKVTTMLCARAKRVCIEDLNVKGMTANHRLARAVSDIGFWEFRRQLGYKVKIYNTELMIADRWFPSSKTCSCCGAVKETLSLAERVFHCSQCGLSVDRDVNAARNLSTLGLRESNACGHERLVKAVDEAGTKQRIFLCAT